MFRGLWVRVRVLGSGFGIRVSAMEDRAIDCYCCTLDESSKYAAESITADRLSPNLPLDGWQSSHDKPEQLRNSHSAAERQPQTSVNETCVPIHQRAQASAAFTESGNADL